MLISKIINGLRNDVIDAVDKGFIDQIPMYISMAKDRALVEMKKLVDYAFANGMRQVQKDCNIQREPRVSITNLRQVEFNCQQDLERFLQICSDC